MSMKSTKSSDSTPAHPSAQEPLAAWRLAHYVALATPFATGPLSERHDPVHVFACAILELAAALAQPPVQPLDEQAIQQRLSEATPGPWVTAGGVILASKNSVVCQTDELPVIGRVIEAKENFANAALIAHAPEDLRALLLKLAQMREALVEAAIPLEVLNGGEPIAALSPELRAGIANGVACIRKALAAAPARPEAK